MDELEDNFIGSDVDPEVCEPFPSDVIRQLMDSLCDAVERYI
jgi:hypothetical protein